MHAFRSQQNARADVPEHVTFRTKPQIALDQIRAALVAGVSIEFVLADAGYGTDTGLPQRRERNRVDLRCRYPVLN
jgi:SRSO17 transposase